MTETPRTDAELHWVDWNGNEIQMVQVEFARILERELAEAKAQLSAGMLLSAERTPSARTVHSKSEYKRLTAQRANVSPPSATLPPAEAVRAAKDWEAGFDAQEVDVNAMVAYILRLAAPQGNASGSKSGVVESSTDDRPKARNENGSANTPAESATVEVPRREEIIALANEVDQIGEALISTNKIRGMQLVSLGHRISLLAATQERKKP